MPIKFSNVAPKEAVVELANLLDPFNAATSHVKLPLHCCIGVLPGPPLPSAWVCSWLLSGGLRLKSIFGCSQEPPPRGLRSMISDMHQGEASNGRIHGFVWRKFIKEASIPLVVTFDNNESSRPYILKYFKSPQIKALFFTSFTNDKIGAYKTQLHKAVVEYKSKNISFLLGDPVTGQGAFQVILEASIRGDRRIPEKDVTVLSQSIDVDGEARAQSRIEIYFKNTFHLECQSQSPICICHHFFVIEVSIHMVREGYPQSEIYLPSWNFARGFRTFKESYYTHTHTHIYIYIGLRVADLFKVLATGSHASPGVAVGQVVFSAETWHALENDVIARN